MPSHLHSHETTLQTPPALSGYKKVSESSFWASSGVRAGDRIVAVNGTTGPAEKLLSLLRRDSKKRRLTLVRPQTEESVGWRDSARARRKLFV